MTPRLKAALGSIVALAIVLAPLPLDAQRRQVLTRAELDAGGWTRLSELVFAVRGVARTSVDGITVAGDVAGLPSWGMAPDNSGWHVLVDGHPMPVALGGAQVLDLLPVSLAQLDSVTLERAPTVAAGRIAMHGVLHLHTQRGIRELRASASHYSGNEVGDPGPFAFTGAATPNVDNSGPFHQARLAYGTGNADADVALRRWTDNLTDQRLQRRYIPAAAPAGPDLWVRHLAPTARAGFGAAGGRHDLHAGVATLDGTFFVPAPRADQSLATQLAFGGVSGHFGSPTAVKASYRLQASRFAADPYDAPLPATLAHTRDLLAGAADVSGDVHGMRVTAGLSAARHSLDAAPARSTVIPRGELELDGLLSLEAPGRWQRIVAVTAGRGTGGARGSTLATISHAVDSANVVSVTAAFAVRALGDDGAWIHLALFGLDSLAAGRRASTTATAEWTRRLHHGATLALAGTVRREGGVRIVTPGADPSLSDVATRAGMAESLTNGELRIALDLPVGGAVLGGATYRLGAPLGGWDRARAASDMLPRHLLDASLTIVPAFDIRIRPAVHLASATRWVAGSTTDETRVPAVARVDLSLEKWILARRVRLHVLGRNLLNDVERYHPLGADFRLRVFAGATASF